MLALWLVIEIIWKKILSEKLISFLITHGNLAEELNIVAQKFLPVAIPTFVFSNQTNSIEKIVENASLEINEHLPDRIIVFVDLLGGSCWHAAMAIKKKHENTSIVTGVNIPALISFATNFNRMGWDELLIKIEEDSKKAIRVIK